MGQEISQEKIGDHYKLGERLGKGAYAVVRQATRLKDGHVFAVKVIKKRKLDADELKRVGDEVEIMYRVNHPNCVKLYEIFADEKHIYLVMDLLSGGEMFDRIVAQQRFSEEHAASVIRQVVSALKYLHEIGIVHRDLKPENVIYLKPDPDSPIKITDFGLAKFLKDSSVKLLTACGTPGYVAPEVLYGQAYTNAVDLWSTGVILYILLCGYPPFYAEETPALYRQIKAGQYDFPDDPWKHISSLAKDLIKHLLVVDPRKRYTPDQVLQHPWLQGAASPINFRQGHTERIKRTQARTKLRRGVQLVLAVNRFRHSVINANSSATATAATAADSKPHVRVTVG